MALSQELINIIPSLRSLWKIDSCEISSLVKCRQNKQTLLNKLNGPMHHNMVLYVYAMDTGYIWSMYPCSTNLIDYSLWLHLSSYRNNFIHSAIQWSTTTKISTQVANCHPVTILRWVPLKYQSNQVTQNWHEHWLCSQGLLSKIYQLLAFDCLVVNLLTN